jgi:hypothetical protein
MGIMKRVRNTGINGTTSPSSPHVLFECPFLNALRVGSHTALFKFFP